MTVCRESRTRGAVGVVDAKTRWTGQGVHWLSRQEHRQLVGLVAGELEGVLCMGTAARLSSDMGWVKCRKYSLKAMC